MMDLMSKGKVLNFFFINKQGRGMIGCGTSNIANKEITNKHRFHLFRLGYIICKGEFD